MQLTKYKITLGKDVTQFPNFTPKVGRGMSMTQAFINALLLLQSEFSVSELVDINWLYERARKRINKTYAHASTVCLGMDGMVVTIDKEIV